MMHALNLVAQAAASELNMTLRNKFESKVNPDLGPNALTLCEKIKKAYTTFQVI